jgi:hypothetical protein
LRQQVRREYIDRRRCRRWPEQRRRDCRWRLYTDQWLGRVFRCQRGSTHCGVARSIGKDDGDSGSCTRIGVRVSSKDVVYDKGGIDGGKGSCSGDDGVVVAGPGEIKSSVSTSPSLTSSALQRRFTTLFVHFAGVVVGIGGDGAVLGSLGSWS